MPEIETKSDTTKTTKTTKIYKDKIITMMIITRKISLEKNQIKQTRTDGIR